MIEKPRDIFLKGCNEITAPLLLQGFKAKQKGQTVSKKPSKDITLEIYFQSSHYNDKNSIEIIPHIRVYSKAVKEFDITAYKNEYCSGIVYTKQLCYILSSEYKTWDLAKPNYSPTVSELQKAITDTVLPIFEVFYGSPEEIIQQSGKHGLHISLSYFLAFGYKDLAQQVLQTRINQSPHKKQYMNLYKSLSDTDKNTIDPKYNEFVGAGEIKMAYLQGLKLK
ncbi:MULTISPECIES: DUF4304 domain-containing protein [unclassified Treponema]|uniref:DUF4304 domain-containing protein n=1 Tax=unclassified Treponema TaxID=2638727 RepID=UPI0020A56C14|nr:MULTISPECIES: hypothetical protein [unclassified Treponema]UTC66791.1 DUF4304 domain-containing protein [Treponema sp. OMZ 789]UTC69524.1 DUF4304 domain-containing protein [Treponema sp. OMZ 790]UTC72238.1 DUF4304 domain-containing protein [Treponema sp. OMZ 791]